LAVIVSLSHSVAPSAPGQTYSIAELGTLRWGRRAGALAINGKGQVSGFSDNGRGYYHEHAVMWDEGRVIDVGTLPGLPRAGGADINDPGQVVGTSTRDKSLRAFLWQDGVMTDLGTLGGSWAGAVGVNNRGQVVGRAETESEGGWAYLWENGVMSMLDRRPGWTSSHADGIGNAGHIVGEGLADRQRFPVVWFNGRIEDIGSLGGKDTSPQAVNDRGWVVGMAENDQGEDRAFLWKRGKMINLGTFEGGDRSGAFGINHRGQIVGFSEDEHGAGRPFLWEDGQMKDLYDLLAPNVEWRSLSARDINDVGQIVGGGFIRGQYRGFVATPYACSRVRSIKAKCGAGGRLRAKIRTRMVQGTVLHLTNNGEDTLAVFLSARGKAKASWADQSGPREVCIDECPEWCAQANCP